jgi:glucose-6-phosphate isomerase
MLTVDFSNLFTIFQNAPQNGLSPDDFKQYESQFEDYKKLILSRKQGFLDLPNQPENVQKIIQWTEENQNNYKYIVILGIGGSMLGPQTILQTLDTPLARKLRGFKKYIQVFFVDNSDPFLIQEVADQIELEKTLILVQTKSGSTPETISQYFFFRDLFQQKNLKIKDHFVFVTDPVDGYLRNVANQEGIIAFDIPSNVGGRFSVLSSVGLLVACLVGLDIESMLAGARDIKKDFFDGQNQAAYNLALTQFLLSKKNKNITVLMPYSSRLRKLADWYTQLLSESIGKELNLKNEKVQTGITSVPALGATDQHSQAQLFKEGPDDKLIIFIEVKKHQVDLKIPVLSHDDKFSYLKNTTFQTLINSQLKGTEQSFTESNKANIRINLTEISEYTLGGLFMFLELSVAFLGELYEIDTFNQPGVERSKVITKEILSSLI